jgi:hypothetical protein
VCSSDLILADGSVTAYHAVITDGSVVTVNGQGAGLAAGYLKIATGGDGLVLDNGTIHLDSDATQGGRLILESGAGSASGNAITVSGDSYITSTAGTSKGTIDLSNSTQKVYINNGATLTMSNVHIYGGDTTGGTLSVGELAPGTGATGTLIFNGANTVQDGAVEILSGTLGLNEGAVLTFSGTSPATPGVKIGANGTLKVIDTNSSTSTDTTIGGNLMVESGGTISLFMEAASVADLLVVTETLTLANGATIYLNIDPSTTLTASAYRLIEYGDGTISTVDLNLSWSDGRNVGYLATETVGSSHYIVLVPEPATWVMLLTAGMMGGIGYWRHRRKTRNSRAIRG